MIKNIIARRYSSALLELIKKEDLPHFENELMALQTILSDEPEIEKFLVSPIVKNEHKKEIVALLVKELEIPEIIHNFLNVLVEKERIFFISDILKEFIRQAHQKRGIFDFELVTAHEVNEKTKENIKKFVSKYVAGKVLFTHKIDPHIKGGFFAYNDELAINASIRNNLETLRRKF